MKLVALAAVWCAGAGAQEFATATIGRIAVGYRFTEGAAWSKDGYLVFSDTPSDRLMRWVPGHMVETLRENANGPAGNAFDAQGRLYTCETRTRRVTRTDRAAKIEVLADRWEGKRFNAPTGIIVGKRGDVYFTDPAFGYQEDHRELEFYGVYHIPLKGPLALAAKLRGRPRGIALSPNGRVLYVADADNREIRAYDLDKNGETTGERLLISHIDGLPGGLAVSESGNLFVGAKGISVYTSDGRFLNTIGLSDPVSSAAFGEADMKSLFATARGTVYRLRSEEK